ncbi:MAG: alpha-2-macroglobulin [Bacteroidales bacterium]
MRKNKLWRSLLLIMLSALVVGQIACKRKKEVVVTVDPSFGEYISAYTSGLIPSRSNITFRLAQPAALFTAQGNEVTEKLFSFSPSINGKTYWVDAQTIEFRPDEPMKSGEIYTSSFELGKLFDVKESRFEKFDFSFRIIPQSISVEFDGLLVESADAPDVYVLEGQLQTADDVDFEKLKKCVEANYNGKAAEVVIEPAETMNTYRLIIKGIQRTSNKGLVEVKWDAEEIDGDSKGAESFDVPELGVYSVIASKVTQSPQQSVLIVFSDLLNSSQNFAGLVEIDGFSDLRYEVKKNMLRVYLPEAIQDVRALKVNRGVQNAIGDKLKEEFSQTFAFEDVKPGIRSLGRGTILPTTHGLVYPFEAVNLKAVTVEIIKIYENNIPYYLQENTLGGTSELKRVGYPIFKKVINLNQLGVITPNKWTRYTLDLSEFFTADPGAMYQIGIKFNKKQLLNPCSSDEESDATSTTMEFETQINTSDYEGPGYYYDDYDYYYDYDDDYSWSERDNPCNSAYYSQSKMIRQMIISSDLGVIAKLGNDGGMVVAVSDLPTAKAKSGVNVRISDFQNQTIVEGSTDGDGLVELKTSRRPFLVTVTDGKMKGYLRVDNGTSNSLSNFDVGGSEVQSGLKGMIYGERGVWRPGDSLHISFILEDKARTLPLNHPIICELRDPKGMLVKKSVQSNNEVGVFYFPMVTDAQAPTGPWKATIRVGGAVFNKTLKVEAVKPNRLKINFDLDKIPASGTISASLNAKWLHGATAGNLKAIYEVTTSKARATFPNNGNYIFDDPGIEFSQQTNTLWEGQLDADGNAKVYGSISKPEKAPAAINVVFKGRVFEQGGDFSIDLFSKTYNPFSEFVGILLPQVRPGRSWLETDKDQDLSVVTVNAEGKPVNCSNLEMELYKLTWRWWWEQPESGDGNYVSRSYDKLITRERFSTVNGKAKVNLNVKYPEWGRFYVKVTNKNTGNSCGSFVYFDWPYDSGKSQANRPGGASVLAIAADKSTCNVGDNFKLTIPGAENSRALISIENGSRVIKAYWVDASQATNVVDIKATAEMSPNVYLHVTLVQPHKDKANDLPMRLYGITQMNVDDPETILQPEIIMADDLKSEKPVAITVKEKNGKKMSFTLAMVDEGLLDINRFKTPDPHSAFYTREAIGVKTWDLYNDVIGAFGGKMERLISIGGDENLKPNDGDQTQRFKPLVRYFGPYVLEKGKSKKINFNMSNYIGSVRVMVVAANNGAYGWAEKACPVRNDLMVMATLPRVLGPQEDIKLPVNVFTMSPDMKKVKVSVKTSSNLKIKGDNQQSLSFSKPGDKIIFFDFKVENQIGPAKVEVIAEGNGIKSTQTIDIMVRNPISEVTRSIDTLVPANGNLSLNFSTFGVGGTNEAVLEASVMPPLNLKKRLDELIHYPHGCVEQTTSAAFPQIYLNQLVELTSEQQENSNYFISEAIKKLLRFQNTDGSFRYWPSYMYGDDWSTSYVGHFLVEAQDKGYDVPQSMISAWIGYQSKAARSYTHQSSGYYNNELMQAYRLYTLALAKKPEIGAMNKLKEQQLGLVAKMRLAAAYALIGQTETAQSIVENVPLVINYYRELSYTYGSSNRDKGIVLETMLLLKQDSKVYPLAIELSKALSSNTWMSTQETAVTLMSLSRMCIGKGKSDNVKLKYSLNGNSKSISSDKPVARDQLKIADGANAIEFTNSAKNPVYASIVLKGVPEQGEEKSFENNINMTVSYIASNGSTLNPANLKKGTDFTCEVTITNPGVRGELKEMALTQIFPSGWEIQNARFEESADQSKINFDYQDIRDDRVVTYFSLRPNTSKKFTLKLTATYAGRYYMPGPYCEAMYDNTIAAAQKGGWVVVE